MNDFDDGEMLEIYLYEQTTLLDGLNDIVYGAEEDKHFSKEDLEEIFRIMHTVKGSAAMMEFHALSHTAHLAEDLFSFLQKEQPKEQSEEEKEVFNCVFSVLDYFQHVFESIQSGSYENQPEEELNARIQQLMRRLDGSGETAEPAAKEGNFADTALGNRVRIWFKDCQLLSVHALVIQKKLLRLCEQSTFSPAELEETDEIRRSLMEDGMLWSFQLPGKENTAEAIEKMYENALSMLEKQMYVDHAKREDHTEEKSSGSAVNKESKASPAALSSDSEPVDTKNKTSERSHAGSQRAMISVSQTKVASLVDTVGEIINMLSSMEDVYGKNDREMMGRVISQMKKKTSEMREMTLSLNLITVEGLFQKVRKIVREMCQKLNKEVTLTLEGKETEIDKNTVEHLSNPFLHLIRNALDHGIESTEERLALGKNEHGTILVQAKNLGREVQFIISDDGCGLDKDKIIQKAKEKNLLSRSLEEYSDKEIYQLIMTPNFSTKETVSEYSGRGVGMNVVLEELEKINGSIQIQSEKDQGTTFILTIPTSLSIVEGMDIRAGEFQLAMQSSYVQQIFAVTDQTPVMEKEGKLPEILIKKRAYPLIVLSQRLQAKQEHVPYEKGIMILVESSKGKYCIFVDEIIKIRQIVVKKLPVFLENKMKSSRLYCGYTVLGNGDISLILDTNHLF